MRLQRRFSHLGTPVPVGRIVKKENGEYETAPLTLQEKMELQDDIDRGVNNIISREKWEELTKDEKFVEYAERFFKEMQAKGEIYCNPEQCGGACCKDTNDIGEPDMSEHEMKRIAKHTGLHSECFTKYIIPVEKRGLWKTFYLKPIRVIKREDDPCLFLSANENDCLKYHHVCLLKKEEIIKLA